MFFCHSYKHRSTVILTFLDQKSGHSPLIGYIKTVIHGKNNGAHFLLTLLQAVDLKQQRKEAGKGSQGMKYSPELAEWASIILAHSPKVYEFMCEELPLPHPRILE